LMDLFALPPAPLAAHPKAQAFVACLAKHPAMPQIFNPWRDVDSAYDCRPDAPAIRCAQLTAYLSERLASATTVLIAEAPGYQGARFSGMAMTSERILLGQHAAVRSEQVFAGIAQRTSRADISRGSEQGMNEPTATVVWSHMLQAGFDARDFVLWNTVAFHPHHAGEPMTNRTPTPSEVALAAPILHRFLALFPSAKVIVLGRIAERTLAELGVAAQAVRHPSMGGATQFRAQMQALK
jgi:Uracil DNA glycosylase superfamily